MGVPYNEKRRLEAARRILDINTHPTHETDGMDPSTDTDSFQALCKGVRATNLTACWIPVLKNMEGVSTNLKDMVYASSTSKLEYLLVPFRGVLVIDNMLSTELGDDLQFLVGRRGSDDVGA